MRHFGTKLFETKELICRPFTPEDAEDMLRKLEAYHRCENTKSGRVLEKSVMRRADTVERFLRAQESPEGEVCYYIEKEAYLSAGEES